MKEYRLGSSAAIDAPGIVRWAINGARFEKDRNTMINIIAKGWNIPQAVARALVLREVRYSVEGETVVFSVPQMETKMELTPLQRAIRAKNKKPDACQWFLKCDNPATTTIEHPVLGAVPCCEQCAKFARGER